jgi:hypothetical protein
VKEGALFTFSFLAEVGGGGRLLKGMGQSVTETFLMEFSSSLSTATTVFLHKPTRNRSVFLVPSRGSTGFALGALFMSVSDELS